MRDMDLIRESLLEIEKQQPSSYPMDLDVEDYTPEAISFHVMLLAQGGYIEARKRRKDFSSVNWVEEWKPIRSTWQGYEFLDAARNKTVWAKAKEVIRDKVGSVPFTVIQQLLVKLAAEHMGLT